ARAAGARSPNEARSAEKSWQQHHRESPHSPKVKTLKTTASHPYDTFPGLPGARGWQIPDIFPENRIAFSPLRDPPLFSGRICVPAASRGHVHHLVVPFFAMKGTPLNCTVFSRLKRPVFKNTGLKRDLWRGLAPFPLELPGYCFGLITLRRRTVPWRA